MAIVKANGYGHGAVGVSRCLVAEGVRFLGVAQLHEAIELRNAGLDVPILVMGMSKPEEIPVYREASIDVTVGSADQARALAAQSDSAKPIRVHVKVDTGMHRLGLSSADAVRVVEALDAAPGIRLVGLWTHFASADEPDSTFTGEQFAEIDPLIRSIGPRFDCVHLAATSGLCNFPRAALPVGNSVVRLGIGLYGYLENPIKSNGAGLLPVMQLCSRVAQIRTVQPGETVSYNRTWRAAAETDIATVSAGYADGYPRNLSNRAQVGINGRLYRVVGTICMDMFMVDLGGPTHGVKDGDTVVLFGDDGPSAFEVAEWAGTIVYEVCTNVSARVAREYTG